ncbi:dihydroorotate dehydrogenase electron transfer subunit [Halanaerobaculum tunisiense]
MPQRVIREIIAQERICPDHYKLVINAPQVAKEAQPGQFIHLKRANLENQTDPLLRRPISFNQIDQDQGTITIVYRVVGRGTKLLANLEANDKLDLMGPLGTGFEISEGNEIAVVGGGMGIAPLLPLVNKLVAADKEVTVLLGANQQEQVLNLQKYQQLDVDLKVATMDNSFGYQGFVTDLLADINVDYVYTCGPEVMMNKVQEWAHQENIAGQASLEERMGCGTGACLSCVCKIKVGTEDDWQYRKTCTAGPIFPLTEVIFDE